MFTNTRVADMGRQASAYIDAKSVREGARYEAACGRSLLKRQSSTIPTSPCGREAVYEKVRTTIPPCGQLLDASRTGECKARRSSAPPKSVIYGQVIVL